MAKPVELETNLAEFTYTVARETPLSLRRLLPEKFYRAIDSERGAMRFAHKATPEQRREFFAYLGIEQFIVYADMREGDFSDFRKIFAQFNDNDNPQGTIKKLAESNVYITSNRELCYKLGHLAQMIDSTSYARNMELIRASYHAKKFKNKITLQEHQELLEERETSFYLSKLIQSTLSVNDMCKAVTGIDTESFRILHHLYMYRDKYFSQSRLSEIFSGSIVPNAVGVSRKKLSSAGLVQRHPAKEKSEYTISGKGILVVNQFRERVIKSLDF